MRGRLPLLALTGLLSSVAMAPAFAADTAEVKPAQRFKREVAQIREDSGIPVRLPQQVRVRTSASRVRVRVWAARGEWDIELGAGRKCWAGAKCYLASFSGTRGLEPTFTRRVKLARGRTGYWSPTRCVRSCAPPVIQWRHGDVLYEIATRGLPRNAEKAGLVRLANSAITAGPR